MFYFTGQVSFVPSQIYFVHIHFGLHFNQRKEHLTLSHPCIVNSVGIKATTQQMFFFKLGHCFTVLDEVHPV